MLAPATPAVAAPSFYSTASVVKRIASGAVKGTGGGAKANVELLVSLKPDVVITYGTGSGSFDGIDKLLTAKLPALVEAGYMEESPLGRAEWVKLIGALTNTESRAEAEYARWKADYRALAAKVANVSQRPVVISGSMYDGTWYMPGGRSFVAQYIRDAGGSYPWSSDTSTGSLSLDLEALFRRATTPRCGSRQASSGARSAMRRRKTIAMHAYHRSVRGTCSGTARGSTPPGALTTSRPRSSARTSCLPT